MSYLVVGISHRSAAIDVLERVALDADAATKLALAVRNSPAVAESAVVATCNRTEVYVTVDRFHAGMDEVTLHLAQLCTAIRQQGSGQSADLAALPRNALSRRLLGLIRAAFVERCRVAAAGWAVAAVPAASVVGSLSSS